MAKHFLDLISFNMAIMIE